MICPHCQSQDLQEVYLLPGFDSVIYMEPFDRDTNLVDSMLSATRDMDATQ